jgi:uncharacterized BrkB/YihY/UPF0761 family membrane protein
MGGRFWISVAVVAILALLLGFLVHGVLLHDDYAQLPNLMRTEADMQAHLPAMLLAYLLRGLAITWIYRQGLEAGRPWLGQGLRCGALLAVLVIVSTYLIHYTVQPWPTGVAIKQIVLDTIVMLILGVTAAGINSETRAA